MTDLGTGAVSTENEHGPFYSDLAAAAAFYSGMELSTLCCTVS